MQEVGAELLVQSWTELSNSVVVTGWDCDEEISESKDSESSDQDFKLCMAIDTDDKEVTMLRAEIWNEEEMEGDRRICCGLRSNPVIYDKIQITNHECSRLCKNRQVIWSRAALAESRN
jgi:hypothetical protein